MEYVTKGTLMELTCQKTHILIKLQSEAVISVTHKTFNSHSELDEEQDQFSWLRCRSLSGQASRCVCTYDVIITDKSSSR